MAVKNPWTPRTLRELADRADVGQLQGLEVEIRAMMPEEAPDAIRWAAREIEKLRSKISWMFVRSRRKANASQVPPA